MFGCELFSGSILSISLVVVAITLYWWNSKRYYDNYWEKRGVVRVPAPTFLQMIRFLINFNWPEVLKVQHQKFGKICGAFEKGTPLLTVADPELLKDILVKDFHVFGITRERISGDPLADNMLTVLKGEDWKRVRTVITPAFTSKRMRAMSSIINECSNSVKEVCEVCFKKGEPVDCKKLFGCFTMDVIARSAFGTRISSASDPENEFVKNAKRLFLQPNSFILILFMLTPSWLFKNLSLFSKKESRFFRDVTLQVIKDRKRSGKRYDDVLQILMDAVEGKTLKHKDELEDETDRFGSIVASNTYSPSTNLKNLSENELLAQCVVFFFAGYETSASTLTFLAYCLATNPDWQERVIQEVDAAFLKHGEMNYDSVREMKVMDAVLSETLRMYPIAAATERTATQNYTLGKNGIPLEKGTRISIPIYALHYDEEYFPDPETFNPNRFLHSTDTSNLQYVYMPFGAGPRNCLGMRFALLEIKMVMANILRSFRLQTHATTKVPLELRKSFLLTVNEMPLTAMKRNDVK